MGSLVATIVGIALSLLSSLLSALGMNLQAAQAFIEQAVDVEKSPSSPQADRWRRRFKRSFSRMFDIVAQASQADGSEHWLYADVGESAHEREPDHEGGEGHDGHDFGSEGTGPSSPREPDESEPLLGNASLPSMRPRRIPTMVEQERVLETVAVPAGTVFWKRIWGKWMWHAGLALYLLGTAVVGSLALCFISPILIAPLSSASLIFNIFFSAWILGTNIGTSDWVGTAFLVAGSVVCGIWGGGEGPATTPETLPKLLEAPLFLAVFFSQVGIALAVFVPLVFAESVRSPHGMLNRHIWVPWLAPRAEQTGALAYAGEQDGWIDAWIDSEKDLVQAAKKDKAGTNTNVWMGMGYAAVGGLVASLSLLLTKSGVDLAISGFLHPDPDSPPISLGLVLPLLLALPATLLVQLYALHRSLDLAPPLVSVPLFFAGYTLPQLPDQLTVNAVLLGRTGYTDLELGLVASGMLAVVIGVGILARGGKIS